MARPPRKKQPPAKKPGRHKPPAKGDRRGCPKGKASKPGGPGRNGSKPKGKIGNPPFVATDDQRKIVKAMIAGGSQQWVVARYLKISEDTLQRHFKVELEHGKLLVDAEIGGSIVTSALDGDADMRKFYMRTRGGWSEKHKIAVGGDPDAPPIAHEVSPEWDLTGLSRAELKEMKRLAQKAKASNAASDD